VGATATPRADGVPCHGDVRSRPALHGSACGRGIRACACGGGRSAGRCVSSESPGTKLRGWRAVGYGGPPVMSKPATGSTHPRRPGMTAHVSVRREKHISPAKDCLGRIGGKCDPIRRYGKPYH
jgi:hypothetical protein